MCCANTSAKFHWDVADAERWPRPALPRFEPGFLYHGSDLFVDGGQMASNSARGRRPTADFSGWPLAAYGSTTFSPSSCCSRGAVRVGMALGTGETPLRRPFPASGRALASSVPSRPDNRQVPWCRRNHSRWLACSASMARLRTKAGGHIDDEFRVDDAAFAVPPLQRVHVIEVRNGFEDGRGMLAPRMVVGHRRAETRVEPGRWPLREQYGN